MNYWVEDKGEVEGQAAWLVGRKVDKGRWVEQGLVSGLDKKIVREFGKLERQVTGTQDVGIYPVREANDEKSGVGKEVDRYMEAEQVDNEVAGLNLEDECVEEKVGWSAGGEVGWEGGKKVGSTNGGQDHCVHSQVDPVVVGRDSWEVDTCVAEQEVYDGWEGGATFEGEKDERMHGVRIWKNLGRQNDENIVFDVEDDVEDDCDVDSVDGERVQVVSWTHHLLTDPPNLIQETYCFLPVPHLHSLIHVQLSLCSRVLLHRKKKFQGVYFSLCSAWKLATKHFLEHVYMCTTKHMYTCGNNTNFHFAGDVIIDQPTSNSCMQFQDCGITKKQKADSSQTQGGLSGVFTLFCLIQ